VSAVVALTVEDYYPQIKRWWLRLYEKNGNRHEMPCHHRLEDHLDAYIEAAGLHGDRADPNAARLAERLQTTYMRLRQRLGRRKPSAAQAGLSGEFPSSAK